MCKKAYFVWLATLTSLFLSAQGFCQSQSEYALIRRPVFSNPVIWRLTKDVTNDYWDIGLFGYLRATALSYIMDPGGQLYTGVFFKLDHDWCRIVYSEALDNWIRAYGSYGSTGCQFWSPKSIASLAPFNDEWASYYHYVYVADTENDRIVRLQYDWQNQWWICNSPITGSGLDRPGDLDLNDGGTFWPNSDDYLWVINGSREIMRFTVGGQFRSKFCEYGCDAQNWHFCRPTAIVCGRSIFLPEPYDECANTGDFYVADMGNDRIVWLSKAAGSETLYWMYQVAASSSIVDLETDIFGQLWAVDQDAGMITKYTYDLFPLCTFGSSGVGENQFLRPISMTNNGGYYGFGDVSVAEAWTDSSGGQYFAIGTDVLDFEVSSTQDEHWHYIDYILIDPSDVSVKIYNTQSQLVKTLFDADQFSGPCNFVWDGSNNSGQQSATGNYRAVVLDSSNYRHVESGEPVNVVTKEAWFHHVYNPGGCCNGDGIRGDVNYSLSGPNVSDVTYLAAYLKGLGLVPPCPQEADVNGNGTINVTDLTYLVAYVKGLGPAPPACP
jgi:hypothetical protein